MNQGEEARVEVRRSWDEEMERAKRIFLTWERLRLPLNAMLTAAMIALPVWFNGLEPFSGPYYWNFLVGQYVWINVYLILFAAIDVYRTWLGLKWPAALLPVAFFGDTLIANIVETDHFLKGMSLQGLIPAYL